MKNRLVLCVLSVSALSLLVALPAGAADNSKSELSAKALSLSNLPTGWSVNTTASQSADQGCLADLRAFHKQTHISVAYENGQLPELNEILSTGPAAARAYKALNAALARCRGYSETSDGTKATVTVGALSFPSVGNQSSASPWRSLLAGRTLRLIWSCFGWARSTERLSMPTSEVQTRINRRRSSLKL